MINKQYNSTVKLVFALIIILLSGCGNSKDDAKRRFDYGVKLFEKGEYAKARVEFKSAVQEDKTLADAYYYLALVNEKDKNFRDMKENLSRSVKLNPDFITARLKLGELLLLFGDIDAANREADIMLKLSNRNFDALILKASVLVRQKKMDAASKILDDVLREDPLYTDAASLKATILMKQEKYKEAQLVLQPVLNADTADIPMHMIKILLDAKQNDIDAVIKDHEKLVKHYPENIEINFALAKFYVQANKIKKAEDLLRKLTVAKPELMSPKYALLELLFLYDKQKGEQQLQDYLTAFQGDAEKIIELSGWMLSMKMYAKVQQILEELANSELDDAQAVTVHLFLAKLAYFNDDVDKAIHLVDGILKTHQNHWPSRILKAKILVAQKKLDEATVELNKVFWANPDSDETLLMLAQIDLINNDPEKAEKKFREVLLINPANMTALNKIVNLEIKKNNIKYANELLGNALQKKPANLILLENAAKIKIALADWDGADEYISKLESHFNGRLTAKFIKGKLFQAQKNCSEAIKIFKELIVISPKHDAAMQELARCYVMLDQRPELQRYLTSFIKQNPQIVTAHLIISNLYLAEGEYKKAISVLDDMLKRGNKNVQVYINLGHIYRSHNDVKKAIAIYQKGLETFPGNVSISLNLAAAYQKIRQYDQAIEKYQLLYEKHPQMNLVANNLAALLADHRDDKQSLQQAWNMVKHFEKMEQPFFLDTYAWILLKQGLSETALPVFEKINLLQGNEPVFKYHLGVALYKQGKTAAAIVALQQALDLGGKRSDFLEKEAARKLLDKILASRMKS